MIHCEVEQRGGFYIYTQRNLISLTIVKWFIPEELNGNDIVKSQMNFKQFDKLYSYICSIENYNRQLKNLYLDIERQPIHKGKQKIKEKCYATIEKINKGLQPYHWEMEKSLEERNTYLIELRKGEDWMLRRIQDM